MKAARERERQTYSVVPYQGKHGESRRPLYVYLSPGIGQGPAPVVYLLQGYSNQLDTWLARKPFEPTIVERLDAMFAAGDAREAIVAGALPPLPSAQRARDAEIARSLVVQKLPSLSPLAARRRPVFLRYAPRVSRGERRGISGIQSSY